MTRASSSSNPAAALLAINGGEPVRKDPLPLRRALGATERAEVDAVFDWYDATGADPGYQGEFERRYCDAFCAYMGGGHADAVATGSVAIYVALAALGLPKGARVLVSPITDPGTLGAIVMAGLVPKLMDAGPGGYNVDAESFERRLAPDDKAVIVVHSTGEAAEIGPLVERARARGVKVLEDCAQAHGALWRGAKVGTFGDIAAFSTMYRKAHVTGASGGVVYTRDEALFRQALAHADRGKPRWRDDFDDRNPAGYLFPALNFHTDEFSCAIGRASLARLDDTIARRRAYVRAVCEGIANSPLFGVRPYDPGLSPFIHPIFVRGAPDAERKRAIARAVRAEGVALNEHYMYLVRDWPWLTPYLADAVDTPNARAARDSSFCLYLNENYGAREVEDTLAALRKVERAFV